MSNDPQTPKRPRRWPRIVLIVAASLVILGVAAGIFYIQDYYHALPEAEAVASTMQAENGNLFLAGTSDRGFILYPGGKVDERAYAPLAEKLHALGDTVVIAKMPGRLAILSSGKAMDIVASHPQVSSWYLVGHSLGGTAASMVLADHPDQFEGIVFLGSYAYKDLTAYDGMVLLIQGTEDRVMDAQKAQEADGLLPVQAVHVSLEGGNHAGYGTYGPQKGDGTATISAAEQQDRTVALIAGSIGNL